MSAENLLIEPSRDWLSLLPERHGSISTFDRCKVYEFAGNVGTNERNEFPAGDSRHGLVEAEPKWNCDPNHDVQTLTAMLIGSAQYARSPNNPVMIT
jgi:hypothetical protein